MEKREGKILNYKYFKDDEVATYMRNENPIDMLENNTREFVAVSGLPSKDANYSLYIKWEEAGKKYEETLKFKRVRRFFAIPRFE